MPWKTPATRNTVVPPIRKQCPVSQAVAMLSCVFVSLIVSVRWPVTRYHTGMLKEACWRRGLIHEGVYGDCCLTSTTSWSWRWSFVQGRWSKYDLSLREDLLTSERDGVNDANWVFELYGGINSPRWPWLHMTVESIRSGKDKGLASWVRSRVDWDFKVTS